MLKRPVKPSSCELGLEVVDVLEDLRLDVGVQYRGQRALVLAVLGHQVRGDRDRQRRLDLERDLSRATLVGRVHVRVQERDRQRLDPVVDQLLHGGADLVLVERRDRRAVGSHSLADTVGAPQRHQRIGLDHAHPGVQRTGRPGARQMQDLLVAGGGDQAAGGPLLLEDHVGDDSAAVQDQREIGRRHAARLTRLPHARDHAGGLVFGCREDLRDRELAGLLGEQQHIRECATNVDSELQCHYSLSLALAGT